MKEQQNLTVTTRTDTGKGACRKLRAKNLVPGVYYDGKGANIPVMAEETPLTKLYLSGASSHVFNLLIDVDGKKEKKPALIWSLLRHPVKSKIMHVDFYGVDLEKEIKVHIPVEVEGKAKGVVVGGRLEVFRDTIEVECLPMSIPEKLVLDVTDLDANESIMVSEVEFPEGVKAVFDDNFAVVGVVTRSETEELEEEGEDEAVEEDAEGEASEE